MCGRYTLFTEQEQRELYHIIKEVDEKLKKQGQAMQLKTGEIYPTNLVPVLVAENNQITPEAAIWGFPNFKGKGVIINARAEGAAEKRMFSKPLATMRCVVPSTGFFEWDKQKNKFLFSETANELLYMAGIINIFQNEWRFVIFTTDANDSMKEIHNRMPVILKKDEIDKYLLDYSYALRVLARVPSLLVKTGVSKNVQLRFPGL